MCSDDSADLTSLAWKNFGRLSGLPIFCPSRICSGDDDLKEGDESFPSLITLVDRVIRSTFEPVFTCPAIPIVSTIDLSRPPKVEADLGLINDASGVSFGVEVALSSLAFLEPDLGVIFELRKALIGVAMSSFVLPLLLGVPLAPIKPSFLVLGEAVDGGDEMAFGGKGALPFLRRGEFVFGIVRGLIVVFCLSKVIVALPARPIVGE